MIGVVKDALQTAFRMVPWLTPISIARAASPGSIVPGFHSPEVKRATSALRIWT